MIDPAQSFSNALNQGLGIMKSYRDEARRDEDRAFSKDMAIRAQNINEERNLRDRKKFGWDVEDRSYELSTLRPLELRELKAGVTGAENQAEASTLELQDLPNEINRRRERHDSDMKTQSTSRAATRQGMSHASQRMDWDRQDREYLNNARRFREWYTSPEGANAPDLSGTPWSPLNFMGNLSNGSRVSEIFSSSGWLEGASAGDRRAMAAFATPVAGRFEKRFGMVPNSSSMIDFKAVGDRISPLVAGIDARTGRLVYKWGAPQEASLIFSKAAAKSAAQRRIAQDPQAQMRLTQMWAQDDPNGFRAAREQAEASVERTIAPLKVAAERAGAKKEDVEAYRQAMANYDNEVAKRLWAIGSDTGARASTRPLYLAYEAMREKNPNIQDPLDALAAINKIVSDRRAVEELFRRGKKAAPTGLNRAQLQQAVIRELASYAD